MLRFFHPTVPSLSARKGTYLELTRLCERTESWVWLSLNHVTKVLFPSRMIMNVPSFKRFVPDFVHIFYFLTVLTDYSSPDLHPTLHRILQFLQITVPPDQNLTPPPNLTVLTDYSDVGTSVRSGRLLIFSSLFLLPSWNFHLFSLFLEEKTLILYKWLYWDCSTAKQHSYSLQRNIPLSLWFNKTRVAWNGSSAVHTKEDGTFMGWHQQRSGFRRWHGP